MARPKHIHKDEPIGLETLECEREQRKADRRASYEFRRLLAAALREGKETVAGILGHPSRAAAHLHHVASQSVAPQQHHDTALELLSGRGHEQNEKLNKTRFHGA